MAVYSCENVRMKRREEVSGVLGKTCFEHSFLPLVGMWYLTSVSSSMSCSWRHPLGRSASHSEGRKVIPIHFLSKITTPHFAHSLLAAVV